MTSMEFTFSSPKDAVLCVGAGTNGFTGAEATITKASKEIAKVVVKKNFTAPTAA